jgi:hypothetical protein
MKGTGVFATKSEIAQLKTAIRNVSASESTITARGMSQNGSNAWIARDNWVLRN